jgi:hypothetical protein
MLILPRRQPVRPATHGFGLRRCRNEARSLLACGNAHGDAAMVLIDDIASRLANRIQLTTDGHKA